MNSMQAPGWLKNTYWPFVAAIAGLLTISLLFIYSASHYDPGHYEIKQFFWIGLAISLFLISSRVGYRTFLGLAPIFYIGVVAVLFFVLIGGRITLGAQRWIQLGPFALQPSEFAKLATVLFLADFLGERPLPEKEGKTLFQAALIGLVPLGLILKQPDLGTGMVILGMLVTLLFMWGLRYRYFIASFVTAAVTAPFLWTLLKAYQKKRILVFLNPNMDPLGAGYTAIQSRIAVGSGGLLGKGYLAGTQTQLQFVPEHHTDFIFCVFGEEWGFIGSLILLGLYLLLFISAFRIISGTTDSKARLLGSGIMAMLFVQVFVNIGMSIGVMPITGITLPLISYGGSSMISTSLALGLILSIYRERSIF